MAGQNDALQQTEPAMGSHGGTQLFELQHLRFPLQSLGDSKDVAAEVR